VLKRLAWTNLPANLDDPKRDIHDLHPIRDEDFYNGKPDTVREAIRASGRSARNFVLLLYGLAPSLPTLMHCHLMGTLRDAELNFQALMRDPKRKSPTIRKYIKDQYDETSRQLTEWVNLVVDLAVALRYIRVRYLHLHIALWLPTTVKPRDSEHSNDPKLLDPNIALIQQMLRLGPNLTDELTDQHVADIIRQRLKKLFLPERLGEKKKVPADDIAIMPDFSPSTMFGDRWLSGTIESLADSGSLDPDRTQNESPPLTGKQFRRTKSESRGQESDPLKADGICQETEQWLWATMRCLKKFYLESSPIIDQRLTQLEELFATAAASAASPT
jgi:hypothetical protein